MFVAETKEYFYNMIFLAAKEFINDETWLWSISHTFIAWAAACAD